MLEKSYKNAVKDILSLLCENPKKVDAELEAFCFLIQDLKLDMKNNGFAHANERLCIALYNMGVEFD